MSRVAVTESFIAAVSACVSWSSTNGGSILDAAGAPHQPIVVRGPAWYLATTGHTIDSDAFNALKGATAHSNGSFTSVAGATYFLDDISGAAVLEPTDPPPP